MLVYYGTVCWHFCRSSGCFDAFHIVSDYSVYHSFLVPLALLAPIYLFEDITLMEAFKKTFRLGFATWGGVFLVSLLMGIIANVLQGVTMMPWYIATVVKYFLQ